MQVKNTYLLLCYTILSVISLSAQEYNFTSFSLEDGLSQSQVDALEMDHLGRLWIGTRGGGVNIYNGSSFLSLTDMTVLPNGYINALKQLDETMWVATQKGLVSITPKDTSTFLPGISCKQIRTWQNKTYVATEKKIFLFEEEVLSDSIDLPNENLSKLKDFYILESGQLLLTTPTQLHVHHKGKWEIRASIDDIQTQSYGPIIETSHKRTLIGAVGLFEVLDQQLVPSFIHFPKDVFITTIFEDSQGKLWIGSQKNGVYEWSKSGLRHFTMREGLPGNGIRSITEDHWGNIWIGTSGSGVCRFDGDRFLHLYEQSGLPKGGTYAIQGDDMGGIWMSPFGGGVCYYSPDNSVLHFDSSSGFTNSKVKCIYQAPDNTTWFGTEGKGMYYLKNKRFKKFKYNQLTYGQWVREMIQDEYGTMWVATVDKGLFCFRKNDFQSFRNSPHLLSLRINDLLIDRKGQIWVATDKGVNLVVKNQLQPQQFLSGQKINCLTELPSGSVLVGGAGTGLQRIDITSYETTPFKGVIASKTIYLTHLDRFNRIWVGTEKGLDRLTLSQKDEVIGHAFFGKNEGFTGIETCQDACWENMSSKKESEIWFGSIKGASRYNPGLESQETQIPILHLEEVNLFYSPISQSSYYIEEEVPQLPHHQNHLSFTFPAVILKNAERLKYRWMLEGADKSWGPVSDQHSVTYSNLNSGEYNFRVQATIDEIHWTNEQSFTFLIQAPFWQEVWFLPVCILLVAGIITWIFLVRIRKIKAKNRAHRKQLEMELELVELEQKALRLQMNPHFLFNCLNSIKGSIAAENTSEAKRHIGKFAKLMRTILSNSRNEAISLEQEVNGLRMYLELEQILHEQKFDFDFKIAYDINPETIDIPPMLIQPFLENSIIHGITPLDRKGFIIIHFHLKDGLLKCAIEDNGIGTTASAQNKSLKSEGHTSTALKIIEERLKLLNKDLRTEEFFQIEELKEDGQVIGTRVTLTLPVIE